MQARPRFSLRMLLGAVTTCCILLGLVTYWGDEAGWVLVFGISPGMSAALMASLARLAVNASVPSRRQLIVCGVVGALLMLLLSHLGTNTPWWLGKSSEAWLGTSTQVWPGRSADWNVARVAFAVVTFLSLSLWIAAASVWRALRCERDDALLVEVKLAARLSLVAVSSATVVSALLLATALSSRGQWDLERDVFPASLLVACAGLGAAFPWIRILRLRSVAIRQFGAPEYVSKATLVLSTALAMIPLAVGLVIWMTRWPGPRGWLFGWNDVWLAAFLFPMIAASVLAVVGVVIELWRDQWHPRLTAVASASIGVQWVGMSFYWATVN